GWGGNARDELGGQEPRVARLECDCLFFDSESRSYCKPRRRRSGARRSACDQQRPVARGTSRDLGTLHAGRRRSQMILSLGKPNVGLWHKAETFGSATVWAAI